MPCSGPFHFSHIDPDVSPSIIVCDVGLCGRKFVLCLIGQCPGLCITTSSRCLAYGAQPAMIFHCISLSWFFSLML